MRTAVNTQYAWGYNEPPRWYYPSSNCLGEMLLNLKRFEEAEDVFRDEIEKRYQMKEIILPLPFSDFTRLPPQSESSLLDKCPGVGKFICENFFLGQVNCEGGKVTEQPR